MSAINPGSIRNADRHLAPEVRAQLTIAKAEIDNLESGKQSIIAAGAIDLTSPLTEITGPAASTYAVTLAAPTRNGMVKTITMKATTATNAVTLALTEVVGGSQAASASFDAAGETLVLVSNGTKWVVLKEHGVTLA